MVTSTSLTPDFCSQSQKGTPLTTLLKDPYILIAAGGASPQSPWFFSAKGWWGGVDGENQGSLGCWKRCDMKRERQRGYIHVTRNSFLTSLISDPQPSSFAGFHLGQRCLGHGDAPSQRFVCVSGHHCLALNLRKESLASLWAPSVGSLIHQAGMNRG